MDHNEKDKIALILDAAIGTAVNKAQEHAKGTVESLGMKDILVCGNCWENPPIPAHREEDFQDDECDDDHLEPGGQIDAFLHNELQCTHTSEEVKASIVKLNNEKIISNDVKTGLFELAR